MIREGGAANGDSGSSGRTRAGGLNVEGGEVGLMEAMGKWE